MLAPVLTMLADVLAMVLAMLADLPVTLAVQGGSRLLLRMRRSERNQAEGKEYGG